MSLNNLNIPFGDQAIEIAPIANGTPLTLTSCHVNATTRSSSEREFLVNLGLNSNTGAPSGNSNDKVTLFSGLEALPGTSDCWTIYSTLGMNANSGNYNAIGYEIDVNNNQGNRGNNGNLITDFSQANAVGISITGNSNFTSTTAILISSQPPGNNPPQWARGLTSVGKFSFCAIQEDSQAPVGIQLDGNYPIAAINLTSLYSNTGAVSPTALLIKNSQQIAWQNVAGNGAISDTVDSGNLRIIGNGAAGVFTGASLSPLAAGFDLGSTTNFWGHVYSNVGITSPSDPILKTDIAPLSSMTETIKNVHPIQFKWRDHPEDKFSFGFNADEIKTCLGDNFAGHTEQDGIQYLTKDHLIAVLWQANREMLMRIEALESK